MKNFELHMGENTIILLRHSRLKYLFRIFMQNTEEKELGLMEFEKKLTHIFGGSGVSIIRNKRGIVRGPEREKGERGKKKKRRKKFEGSFPRETFTSATLILTAGEFFTGKLARKG